MAQRLGKLSLLLAMTFVSVQSAWGAQPETAWQLYQNNAFSLGGGTTIVTLGKSQLRIFSPTLDIFLAGPGHPASIYGTQSKQYLQEPYEEWKKKFATDPQRVAQTRSF